ncbi:MAG: putative ABC transporter permease, partial [Candidatus Woesearchaeota archaeon]
MNIVNILFIFIIFSFIGWIIELIYRSFSHKKVVNPGFLTGPYLPIYGYGSLMIYFITLYTNNLNVFWSIILYFISLGLLEFLTGYLFLKYFKIRLWDYSNDFMNIKGHICLEFMIYWTFLALFFKYYIFPKIYNILNNSFFSRTHVFFVGFVY